MARVIDFKPAAQPDDPIVVTIGDDAYTLPPLLPAIVVFDVLRLHRDLGDAAMLTDTDVNRLGAGFFGGDEVWRELMTRHRLTIDDAGDLLQRIARAYGERR